ncbi:probable ribosome production factor 1 [Macrosteles quadrilineatus]|uniref:probable ribosome production factor 1 n=1 Tax=Macrosteles quadrilineatus TaxID=74068 RepID=UPI0023E240EC|nr:probable ribosome production factor 1 [Macrosteles quadrilineatus]
MSSRKEDVLPQMKNPNHIRNKIRRRELVEKQRQLLKKQKKAERKRRKAEGEAPGIPRTIENTREPDTTVLDPQVQENEERIEEMNLDLQTDEFQSYFQNQYEPKVLITYSDNPLRKTRVFGVELGRVIPNSLTRYRQRCSVKRIVKDATAKKFTDVLIINENHGEPNGLVVIHLPDGPTAHFRLSNVKITPELRKDWKEISSHRPEVILNNFTTRLGQTVARLLASIFNINPEFKGRRAVTFHNQRDYIFFRHHRYEFSPKAKPRLKELGPRFTLRLQSLQLGTFDSKTGEYEWIQSGRRHELETSRRRFYL